ncbi:cobalamin biosynthesis protein CobD [Paenibacillus sp. 1011MAR3C5]|uniref:adenosylcobinamide-phosphate synthase CbiB n=1 Tax=Paenibacillus sp. 1011MAR3C5 TaxID=1675787 RepID=UPI000E6D31D2|nr:adenosylcobinamide-phosphate synthase CbiB [Paenibacillus sp. 1011MAR3C5]RJE86868.1 cobalamin biosynthesis protein CobD [Paenibacillus sp. 1011MAR3C5]
MIFYSVQELLLLAMAAVIIDWIIGDPKWPTHPVIWIGRLIKGLERLLYPNNNSASPIAVKLCGCLLTLITITVSWGVMFLIVWTADAVHVWAGYAVSAWFISTTLAVKGLKDAAMLVYLPLSQGNLADARRYVGYIVGRDTEDLSEPEAARATVETVAENTVDAFLSPLLFALIGGAPLAMLYRSANTLDSMVGYRNETYIDFGWCSARLDDVLNYIPARLTGILMVSAAALLPGMKPGRSCRSIRAFASLHPSPNSGIPESAVAGAIGIQLGGINRYFGVASERARMGWKTRELETRDIRASIHIMYVVSVLALAGMGVAWLCLV